MGAAALVSEAAATRREASTLLFTAAASLRGSAAHSGRRQAGYLIAVDDDPAQQPGRLIAVDDDPAPSPAGSDAGEHRRCVTAPHPGRAASAGGARPTSAPPGRAARLTLAQFLAGMLKAAHFPKGSAAAAASLVQQGGRDPGLRRVPDIAAVAEEARRAVRFLAAGHKLREVQATSQRSLAEEVYALDPGPGGVQVRDHAGGRWVLPLHGAATIRLGEHGACCEVTAAQAGGGAGVAQRCPTAAWRYADGAVCCGPAVAKAARDRTLLQLSQEASALVRLLSKYRRNGDGEHLNVDDASVVEPLEHPEQEQLLVDRRQSEIGCKQPFKRESFGMFFFETGGSVWKRNLVLDKVLLDSPAWRSSAQKYLDWCLLRVEPVAGGPSVRVACVDEFNKAIDGHAQLRLTFVPRYPDHPAPWDAAAVLTNPGPSDEWDCFPSTAPNEVPVSSARAPSDSDATALQTGAENGAYTSSQINAMHIRRLERNIQTTMTRVDSVASSQPGSSPVAGRNTSHTSFHSATSMQSPPEGSSPGC